MVSRRVMTNFFLAESVLDREMNDEDKVTIMKAAYKHLLQR